MSLAEEIKKILAIGFAEDNGAGDVTGNSVIAVDAVGRFVFSAREGMVFCGVEIINLAFRHPATRSQDDVAVKVLVKDGEVLKAGAVIAEIEGNVRENLAKERVVLNLLQHLSGIATETAKYVGAVKGTKAKILDTRKTLPGLRLLQKYAVKCGGGENHRMGLFDMVMIKDNHIRAAGGITAAVAKARQAVIPGLTGDPSNYHDADPRSAAGMTSLRVEVECETLEQVRDALASGVDVIMADNMDLVQLREVVKIVGGKVPVEASGNVSLETVREIAETGVDCISTSKITMSARAVDIGLDEIR